MFFKKKKKEVVEEVKKDQLPYDQEFKVEKVKLMVIIVNRYQGEYYFKMLQSKNVAASYLVYGKGTATKEINDYLGVENTRKDIVLTLISESKLPEIKEVISEHFKISRETKGVAFTLQLDSVAGVLIYKFLTDTRENVRCK